MRYYLLASSAISLASPLAAQTVSFGAVPTGLAIGYTDPRLVSAPPTIRQVTSRVGISNQISGSGTRQGWRSWQFSYVPLTALKVCRWNGYTNGSSGGVSGVETGAGGVLTSKMTVEYPYGTFTTLTWSSASSGTIADNTVGCTDLTALGFTLPAFTWFRIAGDDQYLSGGRVVSSSWSNVTDRAGGDEYQVNTTQDNTGNDTVMGTGIAQSVFPQLVLGQSDRKVWAVVGDSITAGVNDIILDPSGGRGLLGRSLAKLGPHLNYGVPGDRASYYVSNSTVRRSLITTGAATAYIDELGVNDVNAGAATSSAILASRASIAALTGLSTLDRYETTITPITNIYTAGGANYATAGGQTPSATSVNTNRIAFNQTMRTAKIPSLIAVIDVASMVESKGVFIGTGSFSTNQFTVVSITQGIPQVGDVITATSVTAGTWLTSLASGTSGTVGAVYNMSTTSGTIVTEAVTASANDTGTVQDGGVWRSGCMGGPINTDGIHPTSECIVRNVTPLVDGLLATHQ